MTTRSSRDTPIPTPTPIPNSPSDMSQPRPALINLGLTRISELLSSLSSPHLRVPIIHIAGTNGKGSISSYLSSIFLKSGLKTARFNSPFLIDEYDSLKIDSKNVDPLLFQTIKRRVIEHDRKQGFGCSSFEILTATAYQLFADYEPKLDLAIIEVGMGGKQDATNVVDDQHTLLSILTSIELDHQTYLGDTIEQITKVKSGIIKQRTKVVLAPQAHQDQVRPIVERITKDLDCKLYDVESARLIDSKEGRISIPSPPIELNLPLKGSYQLQNASTSALSAHLLSTSPQSLSIVPKLSQITSETIRLGIENTKWPGRLDSLNFPFLTYPILIDGAHNPSSAQELSSYLISLEKIEKKDTLIIAISEPRNPIDLIEPILKFNPELSKIICVDFRIPQGMEWVKPIDPIKLERLIKNDFPHLEVRVGSNGVKEVLQNQIRKEDRVLIAGSLYLVADVYRFAKELGIEYE